MVLVLISSATYFTTYSRHTRANLGRSLTKIKLIPLSVYVTEEQKEVFQKVADSENRSISNMAIVLFLRDAEAKGIKTYGHKTQRVAANVSKKAPRKLVFRKRSKEPETE